MQDTLPSAAVQTDLLSAQERSKSNFENLETAYQTRRALDDAELGGAANGAGLARDTIETARQWTTDNPNQVMVLIPNEPGAAALRDAGLAVGKIENIKVKSMASIEYLVFGGRAEDVNCVVLRDLSNWTPQEVNTKVDELIAAGELTEDDRAVAQQILTKRNDEWQVFVNRGDKNPTTGVVTPDKDGIGMLKTYDEAGAIPNQFRGTDNGIKFSGPQQSLKFELQYYKDGQLLAPGEVSQADYVVLLQESPTTGQLVKIVGDDDGIFLGMLNGLGLPTNQLEAAYASIWQAFSHPFSDTWLADVQSALKAKMKIFSRYFTELTDTGEAGKPLVAFVNGEAYAVKIDPYLTRFDPVTNRAYIKFVGLPKVGVPIQPSGWVNAVLSAVTGQPLPATFLRSLLHIPNAATNPDAPDIHSNRDGKTLRLNDQGHLESWTPATGWVLDPEEEASIIASANITVAPQTQVYDPVDAGATEVNIAPQDEMGMTGDWFQPGDQVVITPVAPTRRWRRSAASGR